jgi:tetratricopeptide (TPR) repeat protein
MPQAKLFSALALLSTVTWFAPQPTKAADIFYTRLFERGVRDLELGLTDEAQTRLRTACFGFLDEPDLLTEGLMQLGRAQAQAGNTAELTETVERLVEIEDRFEAYSSFDGTLKSVFESSIRRALPEALLEQFTMFTHLTLPPEPAAEDVQPLTAKQQRKALEKQLAAKPNDTETLLALAQLHNAGGRMKPAIKYLDQLLATLPEHPQALCLRADIAIDKKDCAPALAGLDSCAPVTASDQSAAFVLECLISADRSGEAIALLDALPPERRQAPVIDRAARDIEVSVDAIEVPSQELPTQASAEAESVDSSPESGPDQDAGRDADQQNAAIVPEFTIGLTLEERIRRVREKVAESQFREHLEETMRSAVELADEFPDSIEAQYLAAEVAYLSSDWQSVVEYFGRTGRRPAADRPELLFYLAVATYELGNAQEADSILREALPSLPRNTFVDGYIDRILIAPPA